RSQESAGQAGGEGSGAEARGQGCGGQEGAREEGCTRQGGQAGGEEGGPRAQDSSQSRGEAEGGARETDEGERPGARPRTRDGALARHAAPPGGRRRAGTGHETLGAARADHGAFNGAERDGLERPESKLYPDDA